MKRGAVAIAESLICFMIDGVALFSHGHLNYWVQFGIFIVTMYLAFWKWGQGWGLIEQFIVDMIKLKAKVEKEYPQP